jgi:hypothetical protein
MVNFFQPFIRILNAHCRHRFKLHMRPKAVLGANVERDITPLPPNKTLVEVFADFMKYLRKCAQLYIEETHPNGVGLWKSVEDTIDYVLSHPNGWEGQQQQQMRQAAHLAGFISKSDSEKRITFVTEGEASLHACIHHNLTADCIKVRMLHSLIISHLFTRFSTHKSGEGIMVVDAGGGTVDICAYGQSSDSSSKYEEIMASEC